MSQKPKLLGILFTISTPLLFQVLNIIYNHFSCNLYTQYLHHLTIARSRKLQDLNYLEPLLLPFLPAIFAAHGCSSIAAQCRNLGELNSINIYHIYPQKIDLTANVAFLIIRIIIIEVYVRAYLYCNYFSLGTCTAHKDQVQVQEIYIDFCV